MAPHGLVIAYTVSQGVQSGCTHRTCGHPLLPLPSMLPVLRYRGGHHVGWHLWHLKSTILLRRSRSAEDLSGAVIRRMASFHSEHPPGFLPGQLLFLERLSGPPGLVNAFIVQY